MLNIVKLPTTIVYDPSLPEGYDNSLPTFMLRDWHGILVVVCARIYFILCKFLHCIKFLVLFLVRQSNYCDIGYWLFGCNLATFYFSCLFVYSLLLFWFQVNLFFFLNLERASVHDVFLTRWARAIWSKKWKNLEPLDKKKSVKNMEMFVTKEMCVLCLIL